MAGTWLARTCRSGSATVMITPIRKLMATMIHTFLERVISLPTASPRGIMDISEPRENSPMPTISRRLPTRKAIMALLDTGVTVKHSSRTMAVMGSTEVRDSRMGLRKMARTWPFPGASGAGGPAGSTDQVSCETTNDSSFIHSVHQNDSVPVRADGQIRNLYH